MVLGSTNLYGLADAREKARELRRVIKEGGDPVAHRDKGKARKFTFKEAAIECHKAKAAGWSDKSAKAFLSSLELHVFPMIGDRLVADIGADEVARVLLPTWTEKPSVGVKLRHRIGLVLDFALAKRWRTEPTPRESLTAILPKRKAGGEFASMPYDELPGYVGKLCEETETMGRLALLFTIYTAARSGEVREARWSHIDLEAMEWRRPADMMRKNGVAHTVTLNAPAIAILEKVTGLIGEGEDYLVFPGNSGGSLSDMTLSKIVRPTGFHVHGFRSTFKTWAVECMPSIPEPVSEVARYE
jgi:integrase